MNKKWKIISFLVTIILIFSCIFGILYKKAEKENNYNNRYEELMSDPMEIEKKWLIDKDNIPYNLNNADIYAIEQTYLCLSPEMRVRKINGGEDYTFTVKANMSSDGLIRDEFEISITEKEYNDLLLKKEKDTITINKTRYQFLVEGEIFAIDIFENELKGLAYLEIEFADENEAKDFGDPSWIVKNVTSDKRYKNQSLAKYGIPE